MAACCPRAGHRLIVLVTARVAEGTLRRAIAEGELPARRLSARRTLVWRDAVTEWMEKRSG